MPRKNIRYDTALQKLQTIMFSRDAGLMLTARLRVSELLRKTAFSYLKLMAQNSIDDKLDMLQFLLDAFACTHDRESQLVVRYEALILRESVVCFSPQLNVYIDEWVCFAEDCLNNGFISNAIKGFDKAVQYLGFLDDVNQTPEEFRACREKVDAVREIRDLAQNMLCADSVQAEATRYVKQRRASRPHVEPMSVKYSASYSYGIGIKKRNLQKLQEYRNIKVDDEKNISTH